MTTFLLERHIGSVLCVTCHGPLRKSMPGDWNVAGVGKIVLGGRKLRVPGATSADCVWSVMSSRALENGCTYISLDFLDSKQGYIWPARNKVCRVVGRATRHPTRYVIMSTNFRSRLSV